MVEGAGWGGFVDEVGPGGEGGAVALDAFGYGLLIIGLGGCSGVGVVGVWLVGNLTDRKSVV